MTVKTEQFILLKAAMYLSAVFGYWELERSSQNEGPTPVLDMRVKQDVYFGSTYETSFPIRPPNIFSP